MIQFDPTKRPSPEDLALVAQNKYDPFWFGPYPWHACEKCGSATFFGTQWGLGYQCTNEQCRSVFGSPEEWGKKA